MEDYGLQLVVEHLNVLEGPIRQSKPSPKVEPGCKHGGHTDCPEDLCDACYAARLKLLDRFGLWAPIPPATPAQRKQAV